MATRKRKTFEPSLKLEVVRMIKEQGQSIQNVSESMDIGQTAIRRWLAQLALNRMDSQVLANRSLLSSRGYVIWSRKISNFART